MTLEGAVAPGSATAQRTYRRDDASPGISTHSPIEAWLHRLVTIAIAAARARANSSCICGF